MGALEKANDFKRLGDASVVSSKSLDKRLRGTCVLVMESKESWDEWTTVQFEEVDGCGVLAKVFGLSSKSAVAGTASLETEGPFLRTALQ